MTTPPWFADDPTAHGNLPPDRKLVSPVSTGDLLWNEIIGDDAALAQWCAQRWLGAYKRLGQVPGALASTRASLHRLAEFVFKPAREHATGKFGLRYTYRGFGTPFFGADVQLRMEGTELVVQESDHERRAPITTLRAAGESIGTNGLDDDVLEVDPLSADAIGDWFGFAYSVLEQLRARARPGLDPSRVQIWPEHFDAAVELGAEATGQRAAYGASPGDDAHGKPYLYVAPWSAKPRGTLWQAEGFEGAELPYSDLLAAGDQRATALDFFSTRLADLAGDSS